MTPGFAKSRKELFWLPYPEPDKVIINAHNFTPAGPTLLGGEELVWCPTYDTAGRGTTTMTDLSGNGRNGTLNNFALSGTTSNWVSDTNNGGTHAIACDGVNDYVSGTVPGTWTRFSLCCWALTANTGLSCIGARVNSSLTAGFWLRVQGTSGEVAGFVDPSFSYPQLYAESPLTWSAIALTYDGSFLRLYVNGTQVRTRATTNTLTNSSDFAIGRLGAFNGQYFSGRIDAVRLYSRAITAGEAALLASGRDY